jgi:hypothetical protein
MTHLHSHRTNRHGHLLWTLAIVTALLSHGAAAQQRWFQIEVLAFSRQAPDQQEQWPTNIKPGYPHTLIELKDPQQLPEVAATESTDGEQAAPAEIAKPDIEREPYYLLPASERKLTRQATSLQREGGYQVLFHQSWRQPINASARNAPAIFIQGGSSYGQHSELEGSITLSMPQLLQVNTRLWLTRFEPNYGQEPGEWVALPKTPIQLRAELQAEAHMEPTTLFGGSKDWQSNDTSVLPVFKNEAAEPYIPQRIILQEEERRMRAGELHYIDHPILGVVIQITPYEPEA